MSEDRETRLRRLRLRSWRRGMRETDLLLGRFADGPLGELPPALLDAYERLLEEADADLLAWIAGPGPVPAEHGPILGEIRAAAQDFAKNLRSSS